MKKLKEPWQCRPAKPLASSKHVRLGRIGKASIVLLGVLAFVVAGGLLVLALHTGTPPPPRQEPKPSPRPDTQNTDVSATVKELEAETFAVARSLLETFPINPDAINLMANAHNQYDQTKEAAKWWRESLEWAPGRVNARRGLAMIAMKEGDYLKAAEMWGLIRQGNARIPDANGRYGEALLEMGKPAEAIEPLEREVRISPRNAEYHFLLGRAHLQLNQYAKAAKYYEKAHEIQPRDSKTCYGLSVAYARSEQADKAGRMLEKFKSLRAEEDASLSQRRKTSFNRDWTIQTLARTLTGAGIVYDRNRESKKAEKLWRRASRLNPKARICRHELASLYVRQGRTNEAIEICLHLQKTYPNVADYHMRAGLLYARLKQWDLAETALKKAVELDPNNMQIKEAYKRVQERQ